MRSRLTTIFQPRTFARFAAVGVLNTIFGYGVFVLCLSCGMSATLALAIATALGVAFNFFTTGSLVFQNADKRFFSAFFGVYSVIYCINAIALHGTAAMGIWPAVAQAGLLPIMSVLSFLLNRALVFNAARASGEMSS
jgi:putative flippase GtrA